MTVGSPLEAVAQAIREHMLFEHDWGIDGDCTCGFTSKWDDFASYSQHVAEVVVAALELREQIRPEYNSPHAPMIRRWVSSWTSGSEG